MIHDLLTRWRECFIEKTQLEREYEANNEIVQDYIHFIGVFQRRYPSQYMDIVREAKMERDRRNVQ